MGKRTYEELEKRVKELEKAEVECKRIEKTLRDSEQTLDLMINTAPDIIYRLDSNGKIVFVNKAISSLGYTPEELIGTSILDIVHQDDREQSVYRINERRSGDRGTKRYELRLTKKDRFSVPFEEKSIGIDEPVFLVDAEGYYETVTTGEKSFLGTLGVARDITERVKARMALRESEKKFRNIVESSPVGMHFYKIDSEGTLIFQGGNPAAEKIMRKDNSQFIGMDIIDAFPPLKETEIPERYKEAAINGIIWQTQQLTYEDRNVKGAYEVLAFQTEPNCMAAVFFDITERKKAETDLAESRENLKVTLNSIGDAVIATDVKGFITLMNPIAEELCGWKLDKARGKRIQKIFNIKNSKTGKKAENPVEQVLREGVTVGLANHTELISKDGEHRQIADSAAPIKKDDGEIIGVILVFRDVSEEYKIIETLRKSEEHFRIMMEQSLVGIQIYNKEGLLIKANKAWANIWNVPDLDMVIGKYNALKDPQIQEMGVLDQIKKPFEGEFFELPTLNYDPKISGQPGRKRYIQVKGYPLKNQNGEVENVVILNEDITERTKTEEKIRESEKKYRELATIAEQAAEGIAVTDLEGQLQFVNYAWARMHGYENPDELVGRNQSIFHTPDQLKADVIPFNDVVKQRGHNTGEVGHMREDGSIFPTQMSVNLLKDDEGTPYAITGFLQDITERKRAEELIKESERKFKAVFNNTFGLMGLLSPEGVLIEANQTALDFGGLKKSEVVGKLFWETPWWEHSGEQQEWLCNAVKRAASGEIVHDETINIAPDGSVHDIDFSIKPVRDEEGKIIFLVPEGRDITERKKAENIQVVLNNILNATIKTETLEKLLEIIHSEINTLMEAENFYTALYDNDSNSYTYSYYVDETGEWDLSIPEKIENGLTDYVRKHNEPLLLNKQKFHEMQNSGESILIGTESKSWMGVPLVHEKEVVGVVVVQSYTDTNAYSEIDLNVLSLVSGYIALAIDKKKSEEALKESEDLYRQAIANADAIAYKRDFASESFSFIDKSIFKFTGYHPEEITQDIWGKLVRERVMRGKCTGLSREEATKLTRNGDLKEWQADFRIIGKDGKECWLADSSVLLDDEKGKPVASLGILQDITERKKSEKQQKAIHDISKAVNSSEDMAEFFVSIHNILSTIIDTTNIFIALHDKWSDNITFPYFVDEHDETPPSMSLKKSKSGTAEVILSGKPRFYTDKDFRKKIKTGKLQLHGSESKVWLGIPLKTKERTIGALVVQSYKDAELYSEKDISFLEVVADSIAVAIQHKRAEEEIYKSREKYKSLFDQAGDAIFLIDEKSNYLDVNRKAIELLGYSREELIGTSYRNYITKDSITDSREKLRLVKSGEYPPIYERNVINKKGKIIPTEISISNVKDNNGNLLYIQSMLRDISERKELEKVQSALFTISGSQTTTLNELLTLCHKEISKLMDARNFYVAFIENREKSIFRFNYFVDEKHKDLPIGEPVNLKKGITDYVVRSEKPLLATEDIINELEKQGELILIGPRPKSYMASLLYGKEGLIGIIGIRSYRITQGYSEKHHTILNFVTERIAKEIEKMQAEEEKDRLQSQLFQAQKMESIGRLAGGIAHDFNNILTGIMGYSELLKLRFKDLNTKEGKAADVILKGAERASKLTRQLLGFARSGKYEQKPLNVNTVLEDTIKVSEKIFEKQIHLNLDFDEKISTVKADRNQLDQVFTNIFINAKDAMPGGGELYIKTENTIITEDMAKFETGLQMGEYVRIFIEDNGTGMPKAVSDKIFEPFFTTKGEGKGTGLGLASVYGIIKNHDGCIYCKSEPGEGTTFSIYLPASNEKVIEGKTESKVVYGDSTILVVDDEEDVLSIAKETLESLDYTVLTARGGHEAIEVYKREKMNIHLILLDMIMPGKTGKETYYELKKIDPDVRVLLSSGYSKDGQASEILNEGVLGFIQKPYKIQELSKVVSDALKK